MNKSFYVLSISALLLGAVAVVPSVAVAYQGNPSVKGPNYTEERHAAMEKAFETKDFQTWKNLMQGKGRVTQVIKQDNFVKFAEAHELAEQGKLEEATKIRQDLGLGLKNGVGAGMGRRNK